MKKIDEYIANLDSPQKELAAELREMIKSSFPQLVEEYKWSQPVYTLEGKDVCYINATKQGVNFGLTRGAHLDDPKGLLAGTGKDMRHIKIKNAEEIDEAYLKDLLTQAAK